MINYTTKDKLVMKVKKMKDSFDLKSCVQNVDKRKQNLLEKQNLRLDVRGGSHFLALKVSRKINITNPKKLIPL
jgi:hypothetical protein